MAELVFEPTLYDSRVGHLNHSLTSTFSKMAILSLYQKGSRILSLLSYPEKHAHFKDHLKLFRLEKSKYVKKMCKVLL